MTKQPPYGAVVEPEEGEYRVICRIVKSAPATAPSVFELIAHVRIKIASDVGPTNFI